MSYELYAAPVSLFSGKARSYLRWKGVPVSETLTSTDVMKSVILPNIGWPVIPVMKMPDGQYVQDTADIIAHIEAVRPAPSVMPEGPLQKFATELLHTFADEWLTLPAMHYRWNYNNDWVVEEFGRTAAPDLSPDAQRDIGAKNAKMFRGFVPVLGITEDTIPGIEASYLAFLDEFSAHLEHHDYLFGARPSLADFAFYGPLYAHLYRDPASGDIMKQHAPRVAAWVERLLSGDYESAELLGDDCIPDTLLPMMSRHMSEHLPVLIATNIMMDEWVQKNPDQPLPRAFGMTPFTAEGHSGMTIAKPFALFRLQAALDIYADMSSDVKARADALLDEIGGGALKDFTLSHRLTRKNFKLALERR